MGTVRNAAIVAVLSGIAGCNAILGLDPTTLAADAGGGSGSPGGPDGSPAAGDDGGSGSPGAESGVSSGDGGEAGEPASPDANCGDACAPALECLQACASGLACERASGTASCLDPEWAEWPVPGNESYTDDLDGTVTDNVTRLMWQQSVAPSLYTQASAVSYCGQLPLAGHHDWRLPTQIELLSIVDYTRANPCIDGDYFKDTPTFAAFWSSTPNETGSGGWGVTFTYGTSGTNPDPTFPAYARCVR